MEEEEEADEVDNDETMLIVQEKLDGDRIQAHLSGMGDEFVVQLFTKWGKNVSALYSDVCDDMRRMKAVWEKHVPCVLDGELIVVNKEDEKALPWSSTKWRYNNSMSSNDLVPLSELMKEVDNITVIVARITG